MDKEIVLVSISHEGKRGVASAELEPLSFVCSIEGKAG